MTPLPLIDVIGFWIGIFLTLCILFVLLMMRLFRVRLEDIARG